MFLPICSVACVRSPLLRWYLIGASNPKPLPQYPWMCSMIGIHFLPLKTGMAAFGEIFGHTRLRS